jgi:hypothetical protein
MPTQTNNTNRTNIDKTTIAKMIKELLLEFEEIKNFSPPIDIDLEYYRDGKKPKLRVQTYAMAEPKPLFIGGDILRCVQNFAVVYKLAERASRENPPELFLEALSVYLGETIPNNLGDGKYLEDFKVLSSPVLSAREDNGDFEEYIIEFSLIYKKFL